MNEFIAQFQDRAALAAAAGDGEAAHWYALAATEIERLCGALLDGTVERCEVAIALRKEVASWRGRLLRDSGLRRDLTTERDAARNLAGRLYRECERVSPETARLAAAADWLPHAELPAVPPPPANWYDPEPARPEWVDGLGVIDDDGPE